MTEYGNELKPCPFCGKIQKIIEYRSLKDKKTYYINHVHNENADAFSFYRTFGFSEAGGEFKQIAIPVEI